MTSTIARHAVGMAIPDTQIQIENPDENGIGRDSCEGAWSYVGIFSKPGGDSSLYAGRLVSHGRSGVDERGGLFVHYGPE